MKFILVLSVVFFTSIVTAKSISSGIDLTEEPIKPIPLSISLEPAKVALGKKLFEDPFLAQNEQLSCAQCHQLDQGGDDNTSRPITNSGALDIVNTSTVFNVVYNVRQTWNGEFETLEQQAEGSLQNPRHGNTNWTELLAKLKSHSNYGQLFSTVYGNDKISKESVLDAFATYEKSLITPNAPFDKYLRGDKTAISDQVIKGYQLFKNYGCIACHQGINVGGNMFQKVGIFGDYFKQRGKITEADYGRFNVTGLERDRFVFRVPSLRNITVTAPYFHDGQVITLEDAIDTMVKHQLGRKISSQDKTDIITFLKSLTGEYQGKSLLEVGK